MAIKKITKRWLFNSFFVILSILIVLIIGFSVGIRGYYYSSVMQTLKSRADVVGTLLKNYAENPSVDFEAKVRQIVEEFDAKESMELIAIDNKGRVLLTSSGFAPEKDMYMPDYLKALNSSEGIADYHGMVDGENIMSVTMLSPVKNEYISALRIVTSLDKVDGQIVSFIVIIALVGVAIIFFVILSSSYFINSIVNPVGEIGKTARLISQGNFGVRLQKSKNDEVGELCDIINDMAEELQTTEKIKNEFISSVSHELRTPLTAIKGWGETLRSDENIDKVMFQKGMGVIINETERLSGMVEELLDFSRIQSGNFRLNFSKIDIIAELSDAVLMYTERARRDQIELVYNEPEELCVVNGDRNRLRQVFINIIDNALKYSDPGDTVKVVATISENSIVIIIADTGIGIKSDDLHHVKNKFYKANTSRRGSGIGLAVADNIVQMHGGTLDIYSEENVGTTVTITIPLEKKKETEQNKVQ